MVIIVEFPGRELNRYARRFDDANGAGAQVLLFTGIRYERTGDDDGANEFGASATSSQHAVAPAGRLVDDPKSAS